MAHVDFCEPALAYADSYGPILAYIDSCGPLLPYSDYYGPILLTVLTVDSCEPILANIVRVRNTEKLCITVKIKEENTTIQVYPCFLVTTQALARGEELI